MTFVFFVEVDNKQPKYLMKVTSSQDTISIYRSTETDVVLVGEHRDRIYQSNIEKCKELDCSQFYTSAFTTGAVSLCSDCQEFISGGGGDTESGPCSAYNTLNSVNFTPPTAATPLSNSDPDGSLSSYNSWVSGSNNQTISRSGYWLGMNICNGGGGQYQCIVSCSSGNVAGCYPNSSAGSVGNVYTIGGSNYQVYDAMQLITSGFSIPTSGTFPLLSGNPTTSGTAVPENSCGRDITNIYFAGGNGNSNCLTDNGHNDKCTKCMDGNNPKTGTLPTSSETQFPDDIALFGDYTNTVLSTGSNCYSIGNTNTSGSNGAKAERFSGKFALGGNPGGTSKPTTIGAAGLSSFGSCGECIGKMLSDSGGSKGPGCCLSACNRIGINGAPTRSGSDSAWSDGSRIWSRFWPNDTYDENYRTSGSQSAWGACLGNTTANSIYTLPCNPTSYCDNGSASMPSILETTYVSDTGCTCPGAPIYPAGVSCQPSVPPTNPPSLTLVLKCSDTCGFTPTSIVGYTNCAKKKSYMAFYVGDCSTIETCAGTVPVDESSGSGCAANIPVIYDKFSTRVVDADSSADIQATVIDTTKSQIASQLGGDAGGCGVTGRVQLVGKVTKLSINGLIACEAGLCPTRGSSSGYISIGGVQALLASGYSTGGGGGQEPSMSSDETASCCSLTIQSPWTPPDNSWNVQNCKDTGEPHLNWIQEAFGEGSSCISNPCANCPD